MRSWRFRLALLIGAGLLTVISISNNIFTIQYERISRPNMIYAVFPSNIKSDTNQELHLSDKISTSFALAGAMFNPNGNHIDLSNQVTVSLVHSYSPYTENKFRSMMIDTNKDEHHIYANSPAILWHDGELITVMRIWLEKEIWDLTKTRPHNTFSDNYFYIQRFDESMKPVSEGQILGIPTPIQWTIGDGPIEPRIFKVNDTIYITFNTGIYSNSWKSVDSTFVWDLTNSRALIPQFDGGQPMMNKTNSMPRDKHWSAIVDDDTLYFTYNLDPLRVVQCDLSNANNPVCHFVHKEGSADYKFIDYRDALRGGTPFILYQYPYYISAAHGTLFRQCKDKFEICDGMRYYTVNLVVIKIKPKFKIVYTSESLRFPEESLNVPIVRYRYIDQSFVFPVGLMLENSDSLIVGGHVNDHSSVLYRVKGLKQLMDSIIQNSIQMPDEGPQPGVLHDYIKDKAENLTGFTFHRK